MDRLTRLLALSWGDRARLLTAASLLVVARFGLVAFSLSRLRGPLLGLAALGANVVPGRPTPARVTWAVRVADRYLPGERTCLMRSLTAETLLRLYGHRPVHRIGVDRSESDGFEAHSWLTHEGEILIGELEDIGRFEPLPPLNESGEP